MRDIHGDALAEGQEVAETWGDDWGEIVDLMPVTAFKHGLACGWGARDMRDREPSEVGSIVSVKVRYKDDIIERVAVRFWTRDDASGVDAKDWAIAGSGERRSWAWLIEGAQSWEKLR